MKNLLSFVFCIHCVFLFAQEPDNQPTNLQFLNVKPYSFQMAFTASDADGYLVVRSLSPSDFVPQDGIVYQVGQGVGADGKIFSVSNSTSLNIREVFAGTTYYIKIFAYNGTGANTTYKTDNPLTGSVTSLGKTYNTYYNGLDVNSPNFITDLKSRINFQKSWQAYGSYASLIVPYIMERDTVNGQKVLTCQYSGEQKVYEPPFSFTGIGYSREHCLPRSWMPTGGAIDTEEGSDYHNLLMTKNASVNAMRSNLPYGNVINPTNQYLDCRKGTDTSGTKIVFEPREQVKGDAARAVFYQMICYNGKGGSSWGLSSLLSDAVKQDIRVLYQWHQEDPVSPEEIARHEYVVFLQNNRNPFIDFPELVDCIDFMDLTVKPGCSVDLNHGVGLTESEKLDVKVTVFPNPAADYLIVNFNGLKATGLKLYNMQGVEVRAIGQGTIVDNNSILVNINDLTSGIYIVSLQTNEGVISKKVIIRH